MNSSSTLPIVAPFKAFDAPDEPRRRLPQASTLIGDMRKAVTQVSQWVAGCTPEVACNRFLAEATDAADLERRSAAWERAQETRRALPPVL